MGGDTYIAEQCLNAANGNFDDMKLDVKVAKYDMSKIFKLFDEFDQKYATSINGFMCTDFCICPGLPTDAHYKEYENVPKETYAKYNRTFNGYTGEINLAAFADPKKQRPLFWTFDATTKKSDSNL